MVIFLEVWWIGKKEYIPEESKLEFPTHFQEDKDVDNGFQGGAGASFMDTNTISVGRAKDEDSTSSENVYEPVEKNKNDNTKVTPTWRSARTAGKKFNFAKAFSDDNIHGSDSSTPDAEEIDPRDPCKVDVEVGTISSEKTATWDTKKKSKVFVNGEVVHASLSAVFEKVEEKRKTLSVKKMEKSIDLADPAMTKKLSKQKGMQVEVKTRSISSSEVEDDIEEFSSESQSVDDTDDYRVDK